MVSEAWFLDNGSWYYLKEDGSMLANQWQYYKDSWYYFDQTGSMVKDGITYQGKRLSV